MHFEGMNIAVLFVSLYKKSGPCLLLPGLLDMNLWLHCNWMRRRWRVGDLHSLRTVVDVSTNRSSAHCHRTWRNINRWLKQGGFNIQLVEDDDKRGFNYR